MIGLDMPKGTEINRLTLKIHGSETEAAYEAVCVETSLRQFRFGYVTGIIFFLVFILFDYKLFPTVASDLLKVRLFLVTPLMVLILVLSFFDFYKAHARRFNMIAVVLAGVSLIIMQIIGREEAHINQLYVGLILVFVYLYSFFKLSYKSALLVGFSLMTFYVYVDLRLGISSPDLLFSSTFFLLTTNIIGTFIAYNIELQSKQEYLLKRRLSENVIKDALTGLYNRHYFDQILKADIESFIARSKSVAQIERRLGDIKAAKYGLFMLDIDHFKRINDAFGHHSGDMVLKQFAAVLKSHVRSTDDVLRVGGEEFLLVLKLTSDAYLIDFIKKIGRAIESYDFEVEGGRIIGCTTSIGMVAVPATRTDDVDELIRYADRALYRSKDGGRNRGHRAYTLQEEVEFEEINWE